MSVTAEGGATSQTKGIQTDESDSSAVGFPVVQPSLHPGDSAGPRHLAVIVGTCIGTVFISALFF